MSQNRGCYKTVRVIQVIESDIAKEYVILLNTMSTYLKNKVKIL